MSFAIDWTTDALDDLREIGWQDAGWLCGEINRLAEDGVGDVRAGEYAGDRVHRLVLPGYRVIFKSDKAGKIIHVWRVVRVPRP